MGGAIQDDRFFGPGGTARNLQRKKDGAERAHGAKAYSRFGEFRIVDTRTCALGTRGP